MPTGIRATVAFASATVCPVVELSASASTTVDSVSTSVCPPGCAESVTEFSVSGDHDPDEALTRVFSHGSTDRYRVVHDGGGADCPCECLGRLGCPVARYVARRGTLTLVFHAADYDQLRAVVTALRARFPDVSIKRLVGAPVGDDDVDRSLVDRSKLTARQLEVLEVAYEMGYFERPRRSNATEVAAELDIDPSTFSEHLAAAQSKVLGDLL